MRARTTKLIGLRLMPLAAAALLGVTISAGAESGQGVGSPQRAAGRPVLAQNVKAAVAVSGSVDLCAKAGTIALPGAATEVPIWGFAVKPDGVGCSDESVVAGLPGPALEFTAGDTVTVTLHNALERNVSLVFPGQALAPDSDGAAPGDTVSYTFTAGEPGTYLYESGTDAARELPMGLYGALIVRPSAAGQAYADPSTAFDVEAVLLLSEIDPQFNQDPAGFNMIRYAPKYWLINGKAYPQTAGIDAGPGQRVLLRYLNAGITHHTMELLGTHQRVIAKDADPLPWPYDAVSETIPTGETEDAIATVPADAPAGAGFPLYNRNLHVTNGDDFPGGMMTFIRVPGPLTVPSRGAGAQGSRGGSSGARSGGAGASGAPGGSSGTQRGATPRIVGMRATVRRHSLVVSVRRSGCRTCEATARLKVRRHWRSVRMRRSAGRLVGVFARVPSGRWRYYVRLVDRESGQKSSSARRVARVR